MRHRALAQIVVLRDDWQAFSLRAFVCYMGQTTRLCPASPAPCKLPQPPKFGGRTSESPLNSFGKGGAVGVGIGDLRTTQIIINTFETTYN